MKIMQYYSIPLLFLIILTLLHLLRILLFKTGLIFLTNKWWRSIEDLFHVYQSFNVPEFDHTLLHQDNNLYRKVSNYINSLSSLEDSDNPNLFTTDTKPNDILLRLDPKHQLIHDNFLGAKLYWEYSPGIFVLNIRKADKRRILRPYLQHIHAVSEQLEQKNPRELNLHVNTVDDRTNQRWRSIPFVHPSTFDTIAMEADLKTKIKSDLESFLKGKQYYHRLGRAWKRSYLLYGPSGTGKSAFVAAMANFLGYDIYDVDLTRVLDGSDLKLLLLETKPKSVILIEDLDRFVNERERSPTAVSFSGVSNFMDGISSCCAEERVMVFTVNDKEYIDPSLLRPGRVDVHIHFPMCDFSAFKTLASSYLGVKEHKLFPQVEEIFQTGASLSPAEIGELMIANRNSPSRALKSVITALQTQGECRVGYPDSNRSSDLRKSAGEDHSGGIDIRKQLYGLLRLKSSSRNSQSLDLFTCLKDGGRSDG